MNHSKWEDVRTQQLTHRYWERVVEAMKREPQCEIRDGVLHDMSLHEPKMDPEEGGSICPACSSWWDKAGDYVSTVIAPCLWIAEWGRRLGVDDENYWAIEFKEQP